jgi:hypothetical protein
MSFTPEQSVKLGMPPVEIKSVPLYASTLDKAEIYDLVTTLFPSLATEYTPEEVLACAKIIADRTTPDTNLVLITKVGFTLSESKRYRDLNIQAKLAEDPKNGVAHQLQFLGKILGDKTPQPK